MSKGKHSTKKIDALQKRTGQLIAHLERETPRLRRARRNTRGRAATLIRAAQVRDSMGSARPSTGRAVGMNRDALATSPLLSENEVRNFIAANNIGSHSRMHRCRAAP